MTLSGQQTIHRALDKSQNAFMAVFTNTLSSRCQRADIALNQAQTWIVGVKERVSKAAEFKPPKSSILMSGKKIL